MKILCRCKKSGAQCMIHNPPFPILKINRNCSQCKELGFSCQTHIHDCKHGHIKYNCPQCHPEKRVLNDGEKRRVFYQRGMDAGTRELKDSILEKLPKKSPKVYKDNEYRQGQDDAFDFVRSLLK